MEDYFLKIDGIPGESTDDKHKDWIELASFSWGVVNPGAGAARGSGAGRTKFQDFQFVMRTNKASPQLFLSSVTGKHIKEASLSVRKAGSKAQLEYLKIKLTDVLVSLFEEAGSDEGPEETVAFNFGRIELDYTPLDSKGSAGAVISAGWDVRKNSKV